MQTNLCSRIAFCVFFMFQAEEQQAQEVSMFEDILLKIHCTLL